MGWNPCQSLRSFASSQPPLLMFTICLMAFGLTMTILAHVIGLSEVPNPDVMDWNKFLNKLMDIDMCIPKKSLVNQDFTASKDSQAPSSHPALLMNVTSSNVSRLVDRSMSAVLSSVVDSVSGEMVDDHDTTVSTSVRILLAFSSTSIAIKSLPCVVHGSISSSILQLDSRKSSQLLNLSLSIPSTANFSCENLYCHSVQDVCLTMQVPFKILPHTRSPQKCKQTHSAKGVKVKLIEMQATNHEGFCSDMFHLQYIPDSHLTEMLSLTERSIVNSHLMHTSYFLFVMVITLLCYALIKSRYPHTKSIILEKIPLNP